MKMTENFLVHSSIIGNELICDSKQGPIKVMHCPKADRLNKEVLGMILKLSPISVFIVLKEHLTLFGLCPVLFLCEHLSSDA